MADRRELRLLALAAAFLLFYALIVTLSPAVREHAWSVPYRFTQWIGVLVWGAVVFVAHRFLSQAFPDRDPFLLPLAALLSGWGILAVWRLDSGFGLRQSAWLAVSAAAAALFIRHVPDLNLLRRYRYVLLGSGLILMALTLVLGTSPTGVGPRLWLGCCGLYLQPSEPLKLLLVVYLAAFLADRAPLRPRIFPLLLPTLVVTGLGLALLLVQRDLGSASILILLHTTMLYLATGRRRVLLATGAALLLAAVTGFLFVDVIHSRLESWLDPWQDPSGRSYQIVQSLLAIANGGVFGRGPGIGSPGLVPVAQSDFIFSAIAEETGLVGALGLLATYGLLFSRGLRIALRSSHGFGRLLAAGVTAYLGIQALIIVAGDLRLLPLTGVTLPFVSYGGSSLLTAFMAMAVLFMVSNTGTADTARLPTRLPYHLLASVLGLGIAASALTQSWWILVRGPSLLSRTDNPRRSIADRYVPRGALLDRAGMSIDSTVGTSGSFARVYYYPVLASVIGYTHPTFGQAGLEASLDDYLRGLKGNPASLIWWDQLLYGTPPPGLNVRLTLDLRLQEQADLLLGTAHGAVVLLNARSGEILVMASHPTYNPNELDTVGASLVNDAGAPLLNRATQGMYSPGDALAPMVEASGSTSLPDKSNLSSLYRDLGFYASPEIRMVGAPAARDGEVSNLRVSPLQMAIAAAALSNGGIRPAPRIALTVETPVNGWVVLPSGGESAKVLSPQAVEGVAMGLAAPGETFWQWASAAHSQRQTVTWYLGGTLPRWQGTPIAVVVLLEAQDQLAAARIGQGLLRAATLP